MASQGQGTSLSHPPPVHVLTRRLQAYLDYAHAMTRLPELHASISDAAAPDVAEETELESLVRAIPKLMGILPDVLYLQSDPRHRVALAEMMSGLTAVLDQVKPLALVCPRLFSCFFFSDDDRLFMSCVDVGTITGPADGDGRGVEIAAYPGDGARTVHAVHSGVVTLVCVVASNGFVITAI